MDASITRRLTAETLGSLLLAATVVGSGIMAERLAGGNAAIALLANTAATMAALATLIDKHGYSRESARDLVGALASLRYR